MIRLFWIKEGFGDCEDIARINDSLYSRKSEVFYILILQQDAGKHEREGGTSRPRTLGTG